MLFCKNFHSFATGFLEIRNLMSLYSNHLMQYGKQGADITLPYEVHTIVRAIETLFFSRFSCVTGAYVSVRVGAMKVGSSDVSSLEYQTQAHSWLVFKEDPRFILDVLPAQGIFGLTQVTPLFLGDNRFGYVTSGDVDPKYWEPEKYKKMCEDVNILSDMLQNFMVEVPE